MINGVINAIKYFESVRKEQAQRQSDCTPWLPLAAGANAAVAPLGSPANTIPKKEDGCDCCCDGACSDCIDYQMTLNQAI